MEWGGCYGKTDRNFNDLVRLCRTFVPMDEGAAMQGFAYGRMDKDLCRF